MTTLKSLAQSAMLGIGNGFTLPVLEQTQLPHADPAAALLICAVVTGTAELGGRMPVPLENIRAACPPESRLQMSERAAGLFKRVLYGEYEAVLPEFLQLAGESGHIAPPETLPALLGLGKKELRKLVLPVLGERGRWLAGCNPAWAYALAPLDEEAWETGQLELRVRLLEDLRAGMPPSSQRVAKARSLVQSTWETDSPEAHAAFVAAFANGLSMDDEPFLDTCLDDRRKEVRDAALNLLVRLPGSNLVARTLSRLEPVLKYKSKLIGSDGLEVSLPEKLDASAKRDGTGGVALRKSMGEKANWLAQMLASIPPSIWCRKWSRPPEKLIQAALASEWKEALLLGLLLAAERSGDAEWAAALTDAALKQTEVRKFLAGADLGRLVRHLPVKKLEALAQSELTPLINELNDKHPLLGVLVDYPHAWSLKLARTVMGSVQRQAGGAHWMLMRALPGFAMRIPPALADEFATGWPSSEKTSGWETWIDQFNTLLRFRKDIMEAL